MGDSRISFFKQRLGSSKRLKNLLLPTVVVSGCTIPLSTSVRTLGVVIDSGLTFSEHVSKLVNTCYYHLRQIRSIRKSLTIDSAHALVRALVLSRLDYCNSLLAGVTRALIGRLDSVMRAAARLILQLHYTDHVTSLIRGRLHWLDAPSRINYKLCVLAYRCQRNLAPNYLAEYCIPVNSVSGRSRLRSATTGELIIPPCSTKRLGPRAFAVSCPSAWNSLPPVLRGQDTGLLTFKRELKTVLFRRMQQAAWIRVALIFKSIDLISVLDDCNNLINCDWTELNFATNMLWDSCRDHVNHLLIIIIIITFEYYSFITIPSNVCSGLKKCQISKSRFSRSYFYA